MYCSTIAQRARNAVGVISRLPYQCTTNRVDVNWTVTVIIRFRLASELNVDDTAYSSASAPSCTRTTNGSEMCQLYSLYWSTAHAWYVTHVDTVSSEGCSRDCRLGRSIITNPLQQQEIAWQTAASPSIRPTRALNRHIRPLRQANSASTHS